MFTNFDEANLTLLKVLLNLADIADIAEEAKKNKEQEQEKQKGGCESCDDCSYGSDEDEDEDGIESCSECDHYNDCDCAEERNTEKEEFKNKMNWLEQCRRVFLHDFIDWIAALPYLPNEMVDDINRNHVQIVKQLERCFKQEVEPSIAVNMISKKSIGIADIFKAFNLILVDPSKEKDENKSKEKAAKVFSKEKELLNALKAVRFTEKGKDND